MLVTISTIKERKWLSMVAVVSQTTQPAQSSLVVISSMNHFFLNISPCNLTYNTVNHILVVVTCGLHCNISTCRPPFLRPKINNCLFPLYLPTQQNAPTQRILFANFKSKYSFLPFCTKKEQILSYCITFTYTFCELKKKDFVPTYRLDTLKGQ
jgi:hypothetical protein